MTQSEAESQELDGRLGRLGEELEVGRQRVAEQDARTEAAGQRLEAKGRERDALQAALADRERGIESSRQAVLRLLGEAASLKNQLGQIDTYLAALDRDAAKAQKEEQSAASDLEWIGASKAELSLKLAAGNWSWSRSPTSAPATSRNWRTAEASWRRCAVPSTGSARSSPGSRRGGIRSRRSSPTAPTPRTP